jgi:hypothetical protein
VEAPGNSEKFLHRAKIICLWLKGARPQLASLADLGMADARLLARSFTNPRLLSFAQSLVGHSPHFDAAFKDEFARHRLRRMDNPRQPYEPHEIERICVAARGIVRRARERIRAHRELVARYRAGDLDHLDEKSGRRQLAMALDHCTRTNDIPRGLRGTPSRLARRAVNESGGVSLMMLIHPLPKETWAFAVLLAAQTGLNRSVIDELKAPHLLASGPGEPGIAILDTYKPRRGANAHGTFPLSAFPPELVSGAAGVRKPLKNRSLNAPY